MGVAAYWRGSQVISRGLGFSDAISDRQRRESYRQARPEGWGEKSKARAIDHANRILSGVRKYGLDFDVEVLVAAVEDRARVSTKTAQEAVRIALLEVEKKKNPTRYVIEEAYPIQRGSLERGTAPIMGWKVYRYTQRFPTVRAAKVWFMRHYDPDWERMPEDRCVDNFNRLSRNLKHFRVGREKF